MNRKRLAWVLAAGSLSVAALLVTLTEGSEARTGVASVEPNVTVCVVSAKAPRVEVTSSVTAAAARALLARPLSYAGPCSRYGAPSALGQGTVRTYVQRREGVPMAVGVVFPSSTLTGLPTDYSDGHHCFDVDADGAIDPMMECAGGYERPLTLPQTPEVPLKWALVNWNPHGHGVPGVYTYPHFDFHFYIQPKAERDAIGPGPCGIVVDCSDFAIGSKPLPAAYFPTGYTDISAVEVAMGNHLVDESGDEWQGQPFMHTFVYGAYDAKVSFIEPMISLAYLTQVRDGQAQAACYPIKQPQAWQKAGWYPTQYCVRYRANRDDFTVSIESFVRHT